MYSCDVAGPSSHSEEQQRGTIFVAGLKMETTEDDLFDYFIKIGPLTDYAIMKDWRTGEPNGFGSVTFQYPFLVDVAIRDSPHFILDKEVRIMRTLPWEADVYEGEFRDLFTRYREVNNHQIMWDQSTNRSHGFGFNTFNSEEAVDGLLSMGNRIVFPEAQAEARLVEPRGAAASKDSSPNTLYVGGIPLDVTQDDFRDFFKQYGEVKDCKIIRHHHTNISQCYGFITFDSEKVVDNLLATRRKINFAGVKVKIGKARKMTNLPPPPSSEPDNVSGSFSYGGGQGNAYDRYGGGPAVGHHRSGGIYGGRGGHAGAMGHPYREPSLRYASHYGEYDLGGYGGETGQYSGGASRGGSYGHVAHQSVYDGGRGGAHEGATEPSLGYANPYGGDFRRGYDLGGYDGTSENYGQYSGGAGRGRSFGRGAHQSVYDGGRGGARGGASGGPVYRSRGYGGSRYHTYGR